MTEASWASRAAPIETDPEREAEGLQAVLTASGDRVFLREGQDSRAFTLGDLRRWASTAAGALGDRPPREATAGGAAAAGICVESPFELVAGLLGAWTAECPAVLIDPGSRSEIEELVRRWPDMTILGGGNGRPGARRISVSRPADREVPLRVPRPGDPAVSFFTSGSEGLPKLVAKNGRQVYCHAATASRMLGVPPRPRALSFVPLVHILGFTYALMVPLRAGGETWIATGLSPSRMRDAIHAYRPHVVVATAVHYRFLNSALAKDEALPGAIYISSGAPLAAADRKTFVEKTGQSITELYGSTETAGIAWRSGDAPWSPYPGVEVRIEGDCLAVRSPWTPEGSSGAWVRTQDVAEPQGNGFRLLGRAGSIVKVGGKRFSSVEVEQALRAHPLVEDVACVPYERYGEPALAAFYVPAAGGAPSPGELRAFLHERLASFKVPRTFRRLAALPRTKLEKLEYARLSELAAEATGGTAAPVRER